MGRLRRHITYANVVATLALVLAAGSGGVYAANKIGGSQIRKGAVRSIQIKNRQVRRQDIAGGSINSRKVSNSSLTGKEIRKDAIEGVDVNEASLGLVPLAQDARTLNGIGGRLVRVSQPDPSGLAPAVVQGGLSVAMSCAGGTAGLQVTGSAGGDVGSVFHGEGDSDASDEFDAGSPTSFTTGDFATGFATVRRVDGTVTRLDYELRVLPGGFGSGDGCFLHGFLLSGK